MSSWIAYTCGRASASASSWSGEGAVGGSGSDARNDMVRLPWSLYATSPNSAATLGLT